MTPALAVLDGAQHDRGAGVAEEDDQVAEAGVPVPLLLRRRRLRLADRVGEVLARPRHEARCAPRPRRGARSSPSRPGCARRRAAGRRGTPSTAGGCRSRAPGAGPSWPGGGCRSRGSSGRESWSRTRPCRPRPSRRRRQQGPSWRRRRRGRRSRRPGLAKLRASTPLRSRIHSSLVSRMRAICAFVTRTVAISLPLPTMTARAMKPPFARCARSRAPGHALG